MLNYASLNIQLKKTEDMVLYYLQAVYCFVNQPPFITPNTCFSLFRKFIFHVLNSYTVELSLKRVISSCSKARRISFLVSE